MMSLFDRFHAARTEYLRLLRGLYLAHRPDEICSFAGLPVAARDWLDSAYGNQLDFFVDNRKRDDGMWEYYLGLRLGPEHHLGCRIPEDSPGIPTTLFGRKYEDTGSVDFGMCAEGMQVDEFLDSYGYGFVPAGMTPKDERKLMRTLQSRDEIDDDQWRSITRGEHRLKPEHLVLVRVLVAMGQNIYRSKREKVGLMCECPSHFNDGCWTFPCLS
jgi:hypothetical protein